MQGWTLRVGRDKAGGRVVVRTREDLATLHRPGLDVCAQIGLPIASGGFPTPTEEASLSTITLAVERALADDGLLVAHATTGGLRRLFGYLVDAQPVRYRVEAALARHGVPPAALITRADRDWRTVASLA